MSAILISLNRGGQFLFLWDEQNLYVGLRCLDQKPAHVGPDNQIWNGDAVEFYLDTRRGDKLGAAQFGPGSLHAFWTPFTKTEIKPRIQVRPLPAFKDFKLQGAEVAGEKTPWGWTAEFKLPWANFPEFKAKAGEIIGIDCELCSSDGGQRVDRTFVYSGPAAVGSPSAFGRVKLVDKIEADDLKSMGRALLPMALTKSGNYGWMYGTVCLSPSIEKTVAKIEGSIIGGDGKVRKKTLGSRKTLDGGFVMWTGSWELFDLPAGNIHPEIDGVGQGREGGNVEEREVLTRECSLEVKAQSDRGRRQQPKSPTTPSEVYPMHKQGIKPRLQERRTMTRFGHRLVMLGAILLIASGITGPAEAQKAGKKITVPENVVFEPNIEFSNPDNQHLQLDMARPKTGDGPFPAIVCIHGGGFRAGSRQGYDGLCIRLAQQGYVAVTVSYRLAPKYQFPAAIHDVKAAVRWLRANAKQYKVDPARIGVTGGSAGGHLAQFLGVTADVKRFEGTGGNAEQSSRVACVVNYYGPSDFTKSYGKSVDAAQVLPLWLGGNLEQARAQAHCRQPALLGDARRRSDPLHSRHGRQVCGPRAGGVAGR